MNADREVTLIENLQESQHKLKQNIWEVLQSLSGSPHVPPSSFENVESKFDKAVQEIRHIEKINDMLQTTKPLERGRENTKKCEDSVTFRKISSFFHNNTERFLRRNPCYQYDFDALAEEVGHITGKEVVFEGDFLPYFSLDISKKLTCDEVQNYFVVKFIFSVDHRPAFIVVHGSSERDRSPFEQSDYRVFRTLAVYFSRVLPDFMLKFKHRGLIEFIIWLTCYNDVFTTPCAKCGKLIDRDLTGDLLPPIIRTVGQCGAYHIRCAPLEIELPDFGYVTQMSEDQVQENRPHVQTK